MELQFRKEEQCHYCRETGHKLVMDNADVRREIVRDEDGTLLYSHVHDDGQWPNAIHWFPWNAWMEESR